MVWLRAMALLIIVASVAAYGARVSWFGVLFAPKGVQARMFDGITDASVFGKAYSDTLIGVSRAGGIVFGAAFVYAIGGARSPARRAMVARRYTVWRAAIVATLCLFYVPLLAAPEAPCRVYACIP